MPIVGELRILGGLVCCDGTPGADGEVDLVAASGAFAGETSIIPPGAHQRIMNRTTVVLQPEIDRPHRLVAIVMGAGGLTVDDMSAGAQGDCSWEND